MAEAKKLTIDEALDELTQAKEGVTEAQTALEAAEATQQEKSDQIKKLMEETQAKLKELGVEVLTNAGAAVDAAQEKLDEAKEAFAQEAAEDPNSARRKLRAIWGCIGLVAGLVIGFGVGYLYCYLS